MSMASQQLCTDDYTYIPVLKFSLVVDTKIYCFPASSIRYLQDTSNTCKKVNSSIHIVPVCSHSVNESIIQKNMKAKILTHLSSQSCSTYNMLYYLYQT